MGTSVQIVLQHSLGVFNEYLVNQEILNIRSFQEGYRPRDANF